MVEGGSGANHHFSVGDFCSCDLGKSRQPKGAKTGGNMFSFRQSQRLDTFWSRMSICSNCSNCVFLTLASCPEPSATPCWWPASDLSQKLSLAECWQLYPSFQSLRPACGEIGQLTPSSLSIDKPGSCPVQSAVSLLSWFRIGTDLLCPRCLQDKQLSTPTRSPMHIRQQMYHQVGEVKVGEVKKGAQSNKQSDKTGQKQAGKAWERERSRKPSALEEYQKRKSLWPGLSPVLSWSFSAVTE